jgi:WD40 repeat protein
MFCLSSPSITDHSEYKNWTPLSGRLKCFEKLRSYLELIYPVDKEEVKINPGAFYKILKISLANKFKDKNNFSGNKLNLSILDERFLKESNECNFQIVVEDDLRPKSRIPKDDNEVYLRKSNSALKAIRNEKISQSLKVNKISEIEDEENKLEENSIENDVVVNLNSKNSYNLSNKREKKILYEIPEILEPHSVSNYPSLKKKTDKYDHEIVEEDLEEDLQMNTLGNTNKMAKYQDNALSDLDQEEYYMKSCYEYFDYDISTLTEKKVINDSHPIRTSSFSPKGDYFAIGTNSKSIKIFEMRPVLQKFNKKNSYNFKINQSEDKHIEDIKLIFEQKNHHMGSIYCLDWSISGRLIASGSNDKLVKLMVIPDLEESYGVKEQETLELTISGHKGTVRSVSFEPTSDLTILSAGTIDTCIKVWDAEKGTNITNLEGHTNDIFTIKWSNDALICASSGADKTIRFWDLRDFKSTSLINALKYADINDISIYTKNKTVFYFII